MLLLRPHSRLAQPPGCTAPPPPKRPPRPPRTTAATWPSTSWRGAWARPPPCTWASPSTRSRSRCRPSPSSTRTWESASRESVRVQACGFIGGGVCKNDKNRLLVKRRSCPYFMCFFTVGTSFEFKHVALLPLFYWGCKRTKIVSFGSCVEGVRVHISKEEIAG